MLKTQTRSSKLYRYHKCLIQNILLIYTIGYCCGVLPSCVFRLSRPHNSTLEGTSLSNRWQPSSSTLSRSLHTSLLFFLTKHSKHLPTPFLPHTYFSFPGNKADVWSSLLMNSCHFRSEIYFENFLKIRIWE